MAEDEFWQAPPERADERAREIAEEIDDDASESMKLRAPKPVFNTPTKCTLLEMKFFKVGKTEKNQKNDGEYTPFYATVTFKEIGGKETEFKESYRGGRIYAKDDGTTSTYIGPTSSLGKFKAICVDNKVSVGNSVKEWATNVKDTVCTLKAETVTYLGKKYEKNTVMAINKS